MCIPLLGFEPEFLLPSYTSSLQEQSGAILLPWKPGESGNPLGRPKGSRDRLSERFYTEVAEDWTQHGADVIRAVRENQPAVYLQVVSLLMTSSHEFSMSIDRGVVISAKHYLGHKNITHTVRYTELSPGRFSGFWRDYMFPLSRQRGPGWRLPHISRLKLL